MYNLVHIFWSYLNVLENFNATFLIAISLVTKSAILIGWNYLFNYIAQINCYIIENFACSF